FVKEVNLTHEEWMAGIEFMTAVGKACTDTRQEFILLSDVTGTSSLVEMINYKGSAGSTENTVLGPFYQSGAPERQNGDSIIVNDDPGPRLRITGTVKTIDGKPIPGATVDVWQTASNSLYPQQDPSQDPTNLRGVFKTDANGRYEFLTVRPVDYPVPTDGPVGAFLTASGRHPMRAAHTHFIVGAPGYYYVTTHLFDSKSKYLDSDAVFGVRDSLILDLDEQSDGTLTTVFDVTLTPTD
ncbi:MAG TPA: dioxygenase, partial [Dehalococcoidia bacterium]|nr:dioxygenase [Dehalococcoidia bacterium]